LGQVTSADILLAMKKEAMFLFAISFTFTFTAVSSFAIVPRVHSNLCSNKILSSSLSTQSIPSSIVPFKSTATLVRSSVSSELDDEIYIDAESLGVYTEEDFNCLTEYEWEDPNKDPNLPPSNLEYLPAAEVDEEGIEKGWTPMFGASNPIDTRTVVTPLESYMIDPQTRNESLVTPLFFESDTDSNGDSNPEQMLLKQVQQARIDLKRVDTFVDPWLNQEVPRRTAKWYGYPEKTSFPKKDFMNNRFTKPEDKTNFEALTPYRARKKAIEMARSSTNEWLPEGKSRERKWNRQKIYKEKGILVGSLGKGEMDEDIMNQIKPALKVLGSCAKLLQISEGASDELTVFRFHYKGAMKNRRGMAAWTETLIRDCGVECTGVVFETGGRGKDKYD